MDTIKRPYIFLGSILVIIIGILLLRSTLIIEKTTDDTRTVFIKKTAQGFQLFRNGVPFYIQGASGNSHLKELSQIGGNTIRVYDTLNLTNLLDSAHTNNLAVIVDIPIPRFNKKYNLYQREEDNEDLKESVKQLVQKHRSHPALLLWNLGNEVEYPFVLRKTSFINTFNDLIDIIHTEDPDHPVSTTIPSVTKKQILSIYYHSPQIDLLSYNIFGNLKNLQSDLSKISYVFGPTPYYVSEWGHDGPWEHNFTSWGVPIEPTSTKKASQLKTRHKSLVENINKNCLGALVFYWGEKHERTHTWFSLFLDKKGKSEIIEEISQLWKGSYTHSCPIGLDYMLVDGGGAASNLVFAPNQKKQALLKFLDSKNDSLQISWEIYPEAWNYKQWDKETKPAQILESIINIDQDQVAFITPKKEGPYRIFAYIRDKAGNFATTNTPFYVLTPHTNGQDD